MTPSSDARAALHCSDDKHVWDDEADAEGDTCTCGEWYRYKDRIEKSPHDEDQD